ncbi:hypothetical protein ASPSYDRAFT_293280 [Aspergillus sydowii CBS 593.65]|uniref:Uncharacterized protein n=1 Tax=Aspergillus sydowii CBS 593.65 TaxID=1036612 RepID=A0A1L9TXI8_9EURO|nr:uncharacterized protein ASPSYDRAFT_293280 [Aspergillus sydowii CBS 593.65]OJJ64147.1 hypothetical protein ASPSYDRAFT_293280 [Aspergillus sydowii CBS 593.65]
MSNISGFTEHHTNSDYMYSASPRFSNFFSSQHTFCFRPCHVWQCCIKLGLRCFIPRISLEWNMLDKSSGSFNWFCICSPSLVDLRFDLLSFASLICFPPAAGFHHIPRSTEQCHSTGVLGFYLLSLFISSCGLARENRRKVSTTAGLTIPTCHRSWRPRKQSD